MTTETKERPLDRARTLLDRRTELAAELAGVETELAELREELRRDPYVEAMLALLGPTPTPTPTPTKPPAAAKPVKPQAPTTAETVFGPSHRSRIRAAMSAEPERTWRMEDVAAAINEPPHKRLASELTALTNMRELERVKHGVYRWAGGGA